MKEYLEYVNQMQKLIKVQLDNAIAYPEKEELGVIYLN